MQKTEFTCGGKPISYEISDDGYMIYLDDVLWIHQYEPYIPYPDLGYEGSCLQQIEELSDKPEESEDIKLEDIISEDIRNEVYEE